MKSRPGESQQSLALDLIRGAAALLVVVFHVRAGSWASFDVLPTDSHPILFKAFFASLRLGTEAVMVFFVLSGFLVGGQIINRVAAGSFSLSRYASDRTTRIFLPLIPACLLTAALNAWVFNTPNNPPEVILNILGLNEAFGPTLFHNPPLWSLAYEIWFYVLAGALACLIAGRARLPALCVTGVATVVLSTLGEPYVLFWALGAASSQLVPTHRLGAAGMGGLIMLFGVAAMQLGRDHTTAHNVFLNPHLGQGLLCGGFCLCIPRLRSITTENLYQFIAIPIRFLSNISYSLYLIHYPINDILNLILPTSDDLSPLSFGLFVLRTFICIGGAIIFWLIFERNTPAVRNFLRRLLAQRFTARV